MKIPVQPMIGGEPLMCRSNVQKQIKACGGKAVYGWKVVHNDPITYHQNHVVWEDDEGKHWDVTPEYATPYCYTWPEETEFLHDDAATFTCREDVHKGKFTTTEPKLEKALEYYLRGHWAWHRHDDLERCRYWTERANREAQRVDRRLHLPLPESLDRADLVKTMLVS